MKFAKWLITAFAFGFFLWARLKYFQGTIGSDDAGMVQRAIDISQWKWETRQIFGVMPTQRYGVMLPGALSLKFFGPHYWALMAVPLMLSMLGIALVMIASFQITKNFWFALLAASLLGISGIDVEMASTFLADGALTTSLLLAFTFLCFAEEFRSNKAKPWLEKAFYGGCGFFLSYAFTSKESGLVGIVTAFVWILWRRIFYKEHLQSRSFILAGFGIGMLLELWCHWMATGTPHRRFLKIIEYTQSRRAEGQAEGKSSNFDNWRDVIDRISMSYPTILKLMPAIGVGALFQIIISRRLKDPALSFLLMTNVLHLAARVPESFFTFSYQPRRLLPMIAFGSIGVAAALKDVEIRIPKKLKAVFVILVIGIAFVYVRTSFRGDVRQVRFNQGNFAPYNLLSEWAEAESKRVQSGGGPVRLVSDSKTLRFLSTRSINEIQKHMELVPFPADWQVKGGRYRVPLPPLFSMGRDEPLSYRQEFEKFTGKTYLLFNKITIERSARKSREAEERLQSIYNIPPHAELLEVFDPTNGGGGVIAVFDTREGEAHSKDRRTKIVLSTVSQVQTREVSWASAGFAAEWEFQVEPETPQSQVKIVTALGEQVEGHWNPLIESKDELAAKDYLPSERIVLKTVGFTGHHRPDLPLQIQVQITGAKRVVSAVLYLRPQSQ